MKVILSPQAEKQLRKFPKTIQILLAKKIRTLVKPQSIQGREKFKGYRNIYRIRIGNYRIVYKKTKKEVYIVVINHRKDVYKILGKLLK